MSFEAVAAFAPLARLVRRSATLDGSVPLRVAQACVPLLEGNAAGHQIVFERRIVARARLGKRAIEPSKDRDEIDRTHRAALPYLVAQGYLRRGGAWHERLSKGWWWSERGALRIWTGLLVRAREGTWLRVSGAKNRAIAGLEVKTTYIADGEELVPLVVDLERYVDPARLEGEIATVLPVRRAVRVERASEDEARELVRAHAAFYDARYFAAKKGEPTKKYRRTIARADVAPAPPPARVRLAHLAGPPPEVVRVDRALGPAAISPVPVAGPPLELVRFFHAVGFRAHFDGNTLDVVPDRDALARGAAAVEGSITALLGDGFVAANRGAALYLTKTFTPHPRGEPHFFVKPWAFVATPPGWSSVVEGPSGSGHDVMRGVVWTDRFHAAPAVFHLAPMRSVRVRAGAPMLEVIPVPRPLLGEDVETRQVP